MFGSPFKPPLTHRVYRWIRPTLTRSGFLGVARRCLSQPVRTRLAMTIGLTGFEPAHGSVGAIPDWITRHRAAPTAPFNSVALVGDLSGASGIGQQARLVLQGLQAANLNVSYHERPHRFASHMTPLPSEMAHGDQASSFTLIESGLQSLGGYWRQMPRSWLDNRYRLLLTAWESTHLPPGQYDAIQTLDGIIVSSRFTQGILKAALPIPVYHVTLPLAQSTRISRSCAAFDLPKDRIIFTTAFSAASGIGRKNPFAVIEAFRRAFGPHSKAAHLVVKAHHLRTAGTRQLAAELSYKLKAIGGHLITDHYDHATLLALLSASDVFVSLHRAEGFGLLLAEAMSLGTAVIATGYSGNMDFMTPSNSGLVRYSMREITPQDHGYDPWLNSLYSGGLWAEPNLDHAVALMRRMVDEPQLRAEWGLRGQQHIQTHYNLDLSAQSIARVLEEVGQ